MTSISAVSAQPVALKPPALSNRVRATWLLAGVALAWVLVSFSVGHWGLHQWYWQVLKLSLEAGMVGGLADWYAITVLFRDPFGGIWVPAIIRDHTSIIPRKKDNIAHELGHFVQENFLAPQHVEDSLKNNDMVKAVAELVVDEKRLKAITKELKHVALEVLSMVDEPEIERMVQQTVLEWLKSLDVHLIAYEVVDAATTNEVHRDALQWGLTELDALLSKHADTLAELVESKMKKSGAVGTIASWFIDTREDVVGQAIMEVRKVMKDEQHPVRQKVEHFILDYSKQLRQDDSVPQGQVLALRDRLVNSPEVVGFFTQMIKNVIDHMMLDLLRSNSRIVANFEKAARDIAQRLLLAEQEEVRKIVNQKVVEIAVHFSREHSERAVQYISEKVAAWPATTMTEIIEEKVGDDLHAIRINGVIVGGVIGLLIGLAGQVIAWAW